MMKKVFILNENPSIGSKVIGDMRDVQIQTDRKKFRENMERLGEILAYELSKSLEYVEQEVETPLGSATVQLPKHRIVIGTILRAGLPLHQGVLNIFDQADNAFISAYRKHHRDGSFDIHMEYLSCPDLTDATLILTDAMLATGASIHLALLKLLENGQPASVHLVTAIGSAEGLDYIKRKHPNLKIWIGAVDDELTAKSYIVPGLGDAGDLSYGEKLQS
jgi:uracil phosphoribosyltransferase